MHAPEEHANAILGAFGETHVPEQELPVQRPTLAPEWCSKRSSIWLVARTHVALQVMTGNQLMKNGGPREMNVVAAHAHHLLLVTHGAGGIRNQDRFAAKEERTHQLSLWTHHLHPPALASERRHCNEVVLIDVIDCL